MKDAHTSCLLISVAVATKATMWTRQLPKQAAYKDMNSQNTNQTQSITPFVVTYHTNLPKMQDVIDNHWQIIETNTKFNCIFPEKPMISFRGPKSLKDILVRALVKPRQDIPKGESRPCNTSRCKTYRLIPIAHTLKSKYGAISTIKGCHTCKASNAVYLMTCNVCNKQFVGETSMALNKRMNLHRSN